MFLLRLLHDKFEFSYNLIIGCCLLNIFAPFALQTTDMIQHGVQSFIFLFDDSSFQNNKKPLIF